MPRYLVTWDEEARLALRNMKGFLTKKPQEMFSDSKRILEMDPRSKGIKITVADSDFYGLYYLMLTGGAYIIYDVIDNDEKVPVYACISALTGEVLKKILGEYDPL